MRSDADISSGIIRSTCPEGRSVGADFVRGVTSRTRPNTSIVPVGNCAMTGLSSAELAAGVQPRFTIAIVPSVRSSGVTTQSPVFDSKLCLRTRTCDCDIQVPVNLTVRQVASSIKTIGLEFEATNSEMFIGSFPICAWIVML